MTNADKLKNKIRAQARRLGHKPGSFIFQKYLLEKGMGQYELYYSHCKRKGCKAGWNLLGPECGEAREICAGLPWHYRLWIWVRNKLVK